MRRLLSSLLLLGALLIAGCGNSPYPPGETALPVLYLSMDDDPRTLDPSVVYSGVGVVIAALLHPSFFEYRYLARGPYALDLALGAEMPRRRRVAYTEVEKGRPVRRWGEEWTFRIRRGLKFQDDACFPGGKAREIVAADFLYSFRRMADPAVPCPIRGFLEDKIVGYAAAVARNRERMRQGLSADYRAPIEGLQLDAADPYVFRIVLNQPYPQLRYIMAFYFTSPQAHEAVAHYGREIARHPVGCGPYRLAEFTPKQRIVLEVNPNRRREFYPTSGTAANRAAGLLEDAGKPLPLAERIVYTTVREGITGWNLFLQGYQDQWSVIQENYTQVVSRQGQLSPEMARRGVRLHHASGPTIAYFMFNMRDPLVGGYTASKRKLRQAISTAIDARAYIDLFSQGMGRPAQFLCPPGLFGYEPGYRNPYRRYDLARARKLLAEAGYPGGVDRRTGERLTITLDNAATDAAGRQWVGLTRRQIEALGIRLVSRASRTAVWLDRLAKGQFQMSGKVWGADYPDVENFALLLYGPNKSPGPNLSGYDSPRYNRLFEQMRGMDDGPARLAVIRRMRAVAVEDCPWITIQHNESLYMTHGWIGNMLPHPFAWNGAKYLRVDGPKRARQQAAWNRPHYGVAILFGLFLIAGSLPAVATVRRRKRRKVRRATSCDGSPP